jgi:hypothetical protein
MRIAEDVEERLAGATKHLIVLLDGFMGAEFERGVRAALHVHAEEGLRRRFFGRSTRSRRPVGCSLVGYLDVTRERLLERISVGKVTSLGEMEPKEVFWKRMHSFDYPILNTHKHAMLVRMHHYICDSARPARGRWRTMTSRSAPSGPSRRRRRCGVSMAVAWCAERGAW